MVSIVLPVFNGEKYLSESIESVLNQTYSDWELIIVDDCSTDTSYDIAKQYAEDDSRIVVIRNEINSKTPKTLNNGFAIARGQYYTWTSDDNMYHNTAIETMAEYLDANADIDIVRANNNTIDDRGKVISQTDFSLPTRENLLYNDVVGACFLYRNNVHNYLNGYDDAWYLVEDYDFWLRASRTFKMGSISECLYDFRVHKGAQTFTKKRQVAELAIKLLEREYKYDGKSTDDVDLIKGFIARCFFYDCGDLLKNYLKELKRISPGGFKALSPAYRMAMYLPITSIKKMQKILK